MHLAGGDADLATHAEFSAIGELRGSIMHEDRRIDLVKEACDDVGVFGDDGFRMGRRPSVDMVDGA